MASDNLLAQQLAATGERVLDVQPKPPARARLLATEDANKNHPNDASVVVDVARFRNRDHFASHNGTGQSRCHSGSQKISSSPGAVAAVTQIRLATGGGRAYPESKLAEEKPEKKRCEPSSDA